MLIIAKIREGNNSVITCDKIIVLAFCTSSDGPLSMNQVSFNSLLYFLRYAPDKLFIAKGINFVNTGDRVTVLAFCSSSDALYQCIKFHLLPFYTFRDMLQTSFLLQKLKREVTP